MKEREEELLKNNAQELKLQINRIMMKDHLIENIQVN